jgi:5-hydroxyisourate hydrolase-like protein (transthyretin family)
VFTVHVLDAHTGQLASHVTITLYTTMQDMAMGTDSIALHANGKGQFSATSDNLSMSGHWAIGIAIQTPDHALHKAGVSLVTAF